MNIEKLIQLVGYFMKKYNNRINYTKLIKELYLSDRKAFNETGSSISGDTYYSLPNGPILSKLLDLIKGNGPADEQTVWSCRFMRDGYELICSEKYIPSDLLSDYEKSILDEIDDTFHEYSYGQLIDYVHSNCAEWVNPGNSRLPITVKSILESLGKTSEEIDFILNENDIYDSEEKLIATLGGINA